MNKETKIRTIACIVLSVNAAFIKMGVIDLGNATANAIYEYVSYLFMFASYAIGFYYNNDFTEEAVKGTELTRALKAENNKLESGDNGVEESEEVVND